MKKSAILSYPHRVPGTKNPLFRVEEVLNSANIKPHSFLTKSHVDKLIELGWEIKTIPSPQENPDEH